LHQRSKTGQHQPYLRNSSARSRFHPRRASAVLSPPSIAARGRAVAVMREEMAPRTPLSPAANDNTHRHEGHVPFHAWRRGRKVQVGAFPRIRARSLCERVQTRKDCAVEQVLVRKSRGDRWTINLRTLSNIRPGTKQEDTWDET
jgi:hypothetical protein